MEGRLSTRLGENVRLLTWVSIFFLPLSFCTVSAAPRHSAIPVALLRNHPGESLWSINDSLLSLPALSAVMPLVAIITYTTALNVDKISSAFQRFYRIIHKRFEQDPPQKRTHGTPLGLEIPSNKSGLGSTPRAGISLLLALLDYCGQLFQIRRPKPVVYQSQHTSQLPHLGEVHIRVDVDMESRSASTASVLP